MHDDEFFSAAGLVAPHPLAAAAGRDVLIEGGNVIEAALAAAAVAAVCVPERNGLGGDALWLIREPGPRGRVRVLDARGVVGTAARPAFLRARGQVAVPLHGAESVLTAPGAVAGWAEAQRLSVASGGRLPLSRLLAPAAVAARDGIVLTARDVAALAAGAPALSGQPGFTSAFLNDGRVPEPGTRRRDPALAATLDYLIDAGLDDFYRGDIGRELAADLETLSSLLGRADLRAAEARWREPLTLDLGRHALAVPPTRAGTEAAVTLGLLAGLGTAEPDGFARWHGSIESLRHAGDMLDAMDRAGRDPATLLDAARLARASLGIDRDRARRREVPSVPLLTEAAVWIGVVDRDGGAVSLVQTLGGAFGSGVVSERTGILLSNRGAALTVDPDLGPVLRVGRRPPLQSLPALLASPRDGRVAALGVAGRHAATVASQLAGRLMFEGPPSTAMAAPRFALGATPDGGEAAVLVEETLELPVATRLRSAGHVLVPSAGADWRTAGAVVRLPEGRIVALSDPEAAGAVGGL